MKIIEKINFIRNNNLHAREKETQKSSERLPKDIIKDIQAEPTDNNASRFLMNSLHVHSKWEAPLIFDDTKKEEVFP